MAGLSRTETTAGARIAALVAIWLAVAASALAQTVTWQGHQWTNVYASNSISSDGVTLAVSTGDATSGFFGGAYHPIPEALQASGEAWVEATFFDTGATPGPQMSVLYFDTSGSVHLAWLGAYQNGSDYSAYWRRDSPTPEMSLLGTGVVVGQRSVGPHTVRIGRRLDGRLEFWLDGRLVQVSGVDVMPAVFNFVYLVGVGTVAQETVTFTTYREGAGSSPGPAPQIERFSDRASWRDVSSGLGRIDFEGLAPAGGFTPYDTPAGLTLSGVNFSGVTPRAGSAGPTTHYLRVVDPAFFPPFYDWGSGAVLHGPPWTSGPQGEGGPASRVRATFLAPVTSAGFDVMSFLEYASPLKVVIATTRGSSAFIVETASSPMRRFVGFASDTPIVSIDFYGLNGFPIVDEVEFGQRAGGGPCSLAVTPSVFTFAASGGSGSVLVDTPAQCSWGAATLASWITLLPGSTCARVGDVVTCPRGPRQITFTVASNAGGARNAAISVGSGTVNVTQSGFTCTVSLGSSRATVGSAGGDRSVAVGAPSGCSWTAASDAPWLTILSATGAGAGGVRFRVAPNTGTPRTGHLTIGGEVFPVTQDAGACGAVDVTGDVNVLKNGLTPIWGNINQFSTSFRVTNTSAAPIRGPIMAVLVGLPNQRAFVLGTQGLTTCFSAAGDYLVLLTASDLARNANTGYQFIIARQTTTAPMGYTVRVLSGIPSR
jgi:hypothetical protein